MHRVTVTGAAGFLGSHLVDALLKSGCEVTGIDNFSTGRRRNLQFAGSTKRFKLLQADLTGSVRLPRSETYYHLASPASPPAYQRDPVGTLQVNGMGTIKVLEAARHYDARVLIASTSEVYGDPRVHPQREDYWGNVNPIGLRSCYDVGEAVRRSASDGIPPTAWARRTDCTNIQHVWPPNGSRGRPSDFKFHCTRTSRTTVDGVR